MASRLLAKTVAVDVTVMDLRDKGIGNRGAMEAVAVMVKWNCATITRLDLRSV